MAQNKNAQIRYKALDKCFSNQFKRFYINDLIEYCSDVLTEHYATETTVSRRQIFDDIDFMKSEAGYDAPIESVKDGKKVFYRYSEPEFTILKKPLNPAEIETLQEALETLSRMNNIPGFDWVNSILAKLNSGINNTTDHRQVISFEDNEDLKGLNFLNPLYQFIVNKQCLSIIYRGFSAEKENIFTVSPYYLKQYNNRWFLFGWNHKENYLQNFPLDRILAIDSCKEVFIVNTTDFKEYFFDIIGVSNDLAKDPVQVKIKLSDNIVGYIESKPLHGSQKKIIDNITTLKVKLNYELESLILFYGENITVLEPPELVEKIKKRLAETNNNYQCTPTAQ